MNRTVFWVVVFAIFIVLFVTVKTDETNSEIMNGDIKWSFVVKKGSDGINSTTVTLELKNKKYKAGTYVGNCIEKKDNLFGGEVSPYVVCKQTDIGVELGVFKEGDKFSLKNGVVETGDDEAHPAYRGDFVTLLKL